LAKNILQQNILGKNFCWVKSLGKNFFLGKKNLLAKKFRPKNFLMLFGIKKNWRKKWLK
jgi:hypothetical protein